MSALGSGLTLPFFIVYLARRAGSISGVAGLILSAVAVAGLLGNPVGGWLADRIGARRAVSSASFSPPRVRPASCWCIRRGRVRRCRPLRQRHVGTLACAGCLAGDCRQRRAAPARLRAPARHSERRLQHRCDGRGAGRRQLSLPNRVRPALPLDALSFLVFAALLTRISDFALSHPDTGSAGDSGGYRDVLRDRVFIRIVAARSCCW